MPSGDNDTTPETSVLKEARTVCRKAKDAYFACVDANSPEPASAFPVPAPCVDLRKAFEGSCRASWVKHFDTLRAKDLRFIQLVQGNIAKSAASARGQLAGEAQGPPPVPPTTNPPAGSKP